MIYADTSFLFALYRRSDAFHIPAKKLMTRICQPIALTLLGGFELLNNVHRGLASKILDRTEHDAILRDLEADVAAGILIRRFLTDADLYARACILSQKFSIETNSRSLDILHVASAELLRTSAFLSYDKRQRLLAQKVGLPLQPRTLGTK